MSGLSAAVAAAGGLSGFRPRGVQSAVPRPAPAQPAIAVAGLPARPAGSAAAVSAGGLAGFKPRTLPHQVVGAALRPQVLSGSQKPGNGFLVSAAASGNHILVKETGPKPKLPEKPWPNVDGYRMVKGGEIEGETFGSSPYKLYETAADPDQLTQEPYFFVWLHGADGGGDTPPLDLVKMQTRLRRRTFFFVPISPKGKDGGRFFWGVRYTKAQNKNDWGFIYGDLHEPYLAAFCKVVQELSTEVGAIANMMSGYSMGGFGAWQIAGYRPDLFTAIIPVAGYGLGTLESKGVYSAPQPESSAILKQYMSQYGPRLAKVPMVIAVHGISDETSPYGDTKFMVERTKGHGGNAVLVTVGEEAADSDKGKRKIKSGHHYFNYALLNDSSEMVLWARLRMFLKKKLGARGSSAAKIPVWTSGAAAAQPSHPTATIRPSVVRPFAPPPGNNGTVRPTVIRSIAPPPGNNGTVRPTVIRTIAPPPGNNGMVTNKWLPAKFPVQAGSTPFNGSGTKRWAPTANPTQGQALDKRRKVDGAGGLISSLLAGVS